ncbi:MAG: vitamin K epoxide reductase family protein [Bryobacteraceae bacterium]
MHNQLSPDELGRELREGSSRFLKHRRGIMGLSFFSCAALGTIALYQMGILKKLPEPGWRGFDAGRVNGSAQAYSMLGIPDALLGLASYAVTACLAGMGSETRWKAHPLMPIGMGLKVFADAAFAGKLTLEECTKYRAFSLWSLLAASATFAALPLAIPEAKAALRHVIGEGA